MSIFKILRNGIVCAHTCKAGCAGIGQVDSKVMKMVFIIEPKESFETYAGDIFW